MLTIGKSLQIKSHVVANISEQKIMITKERLLPNSSEKTTDLLIPEKYFTLTTNTSSNNDKSEYACLSRLKYSQLKWQNEVGNLYFCHFSGLLSDGIDTPIKILDFIKSKDTHWNRELLNNKEYFVLSGNVNDINIKIWIDYQTYLMWQILLLRKTNNNIFTQYASRHYVVTETQMVNDHIIPKVMSVKEKYPAGQIQPPPEVRESVIKQIKEHGGTLVLPEKTLNLQIIFNDVSLKADVSENKIFNEMNIPNGTPVAMYDAPQIQYVWMDGKPVLKTDEVALAIARGGHKFIPGPQEPRFWLIALGIIMMLLGGGLKLRDMLKES
jgi:hypothetical protein